MKRACGGCEGKGAHWRWCEVWVGRSASFYGQLADRAESLADTIGANEPGAANHCYQAGALLRAKAIRLRDEFRADMDAERRDGKKI